MATFLITSARFSKGQKWPLKKEIIYTFLNDNHETFISKLRFKISSHKLFSSLHDFNCLDSLNLSKFENLEFKQHSTSVAPLLWPDCLPSFIISILLKRFMCLQIFDNGRSKEPWSFRGGAPMQLLSIEQCLSGDVLL